MSDGTVAVNKLPKFILGVDLDGVVSDFVGDLRPIAAEYFGVPVESLSNQPDYNFTQWGHGLPAKYPELHKFAVVQRGLFINSKPVPGAIQALRRLSEEGIYIRIITSRICIKWHHAEIVKQTVNWLEHHGIPYWDICFVRDKTTIGADLYIDDSPGNVRSLTQAGKRVICYASSVNEGTEALTRTNNWGFIADVVLGLKKALEDIEAKKEKPNDGPRA